jgi:hypothetical protein
MLRQRSPGTAARRRGNPLAAISRSSGRNPLPRNQAVAKRRESQPKPL